VWKRQNRITKRRTSSPSLRSPLDREIMLRLSRYSTRLSCDISLAFFASAANITWLRPAELKAAAGRQEWWRVDGTNEKAAQVCRSTASAVSSTIISPRNFMVVGLGFWCPRSWDGFGHCEGWSFVSCSPFNSAFFALVPVHSFFSTKIHD